jgi:hypothetical protein
MDTEPTDPKASDPLSDFADGVAKRVTGSDSPPWVVYGPRWAQEAQGAESPPEGFDNPVWARDGGWMEKEDAPIHEGDGEPLALYAPDSMEELDVDSPTTDTSAK